MRKFILAGLAATTLALSIQAMAADFVEGKDYTIIKNPGKSEVPGKIEVREFYL